MGFYQNGGGKSAGQKTLYQPMLQLALYTQNPRPKGPEGFHTVTTIRRWWWWQQHVLIEPTGGRTNPSPSPGREATQDLRAKNQAARADKRKNALKSDKKALQRLTIYW